MAINLANVNLTIDQFQRISDGKFNAGEIRLTSETSIEKINNHVRKTWLNKESISHAEVIAIKQAFVNALQQGGVGDDALRRVREQLGLSPEKAVDTKLNERSLKPLPRQQIREILDENAAAINETVGEGTVRTSDEIYADVEAKTRQTRATKRDETNAELATRRTVTTQRRFSLFQSLVAGDVDYHSEDDRAELLKMAKEALGIVLQLSGGHPREDVAARLAWGTNESRRFTMETGMDEATFARKLEDIIVRLSGNRHADPETFALRDASVQALLAGKVREIGSPERTNVSSILLIAALDRHPGIRIDLGAFFARPDVVADDGNRLDQTHVCFPSSAFVSFGTPPPAEAKAELARLIGAGTPPPVFAQALARAVKAEGIRYPVPNAEEGRTLSSEKAVAVFSAETKLGKALAEILESFPDELTPNALELLARGALRHRGVGNVAEMVDSIRELQPGRPAELP